MTIAARRAVPENDPDVRQLRSLQRRRRRLALEEIQLVQQLRFAGMTWRGLSAVTGTAHTTLCRQFGYLDDLPVEIALEPDGLERIGCPETGARWEGLGRAAALVRERLQRSVRQAW